MVLSRFVLGLVAACALLGSVPTRAAPNWENPGIFDPPIDWQRPPQVDGTGSAVLLAQIPGPATVVLRSLGAGGGWAAPITVPYAVDESHGNEAVVAGPDGALAVTYHTTLTGGACEMRLRLYGAAGWQGPFAVEPGSACVGNAAFDDHGRIVLAYAAVVSFAESPRGRVFDRGTLSFGAATALAPAGTRAGWLDVVANRAREVLVASFADPDLGVFVARYDSAAGRWAAAEKLPRSDRLAAFSTLAPGPLPTGVDDAGDVTVIVPQGNRVNRVGITGFRRSGSRWSATSLVAAGPYTVSIPNGTTPRRSSLVVAPSGEVLTVVGVASQRSSNDATVRAFRWRPSGGWAVETVAATPGITQAADVAWLGLDGRAVVVFPAFPNTTGGVRSVVHDGATWAELPTLATPGAFVSGTSPTTLPGGDVLLLIGGSVGTPATGPFAASTWLRP